MADAKSAAAAIQKNHKGFSAGRIEVWGIAVVRPSDLSYELKSAKAAGDAIELAFDDGSKLVLEGAGEVAQGKDSLTIASASKVTWTEAGGAALVATVEGKKLKVTTKTGPETRALPKAPALFLGN